MRYIKYLFLLALAGFSAAYLINKSVVGRAGKYHYSYMESVPACYTGLILGAKVQADGEPSDFLQDRLDAGLELYQHGKIKRFLLSGDHGRKNYDEVNNMKKYLLERGVDTADIFLDHAGFDTYNSMVRAKKIFLADSVIVVTQKFHLARALYIARAKGLHAFGYQADKREYRSMKRLRVREFIANIKAWGEVLINRKPHFLGEEIPITGDSRLSYD